MRRIQARKTDRGFARIEFDDLYGDRCSIQKSSLATRDAIWLGQNEPSLDHHTGKVAGCRMHLTQGDVRWLLPILQHFADTGELPDELPAAGGEEFTS